jgi:hypothetical protein
MRFALIVVCSLLVACAARQAPTPATRQVWSDHEQRLPVGARPFAFGVSGPDVHTSRVGSLTAPVKVRGIVLDTERRGDTIPVSSPRWLGQHQLVIGSKADRIVFRYDTPGKPAPLRAGQPVQLFAHSMVMDSSMAFSMTIHDTQGRLEMAGIRGPDPNAAFLPEGWSVEFGPVLSTKPMCDGELREHAVRVRGPSGEAVVSPGWTARARLGPDGTEYAIDVAAAQSGRANCDDARQATQLSLVVRRAPR